MAKNKSNKLKIDVYSRGIAIYRLSVVLAKELGTNETSRKVIESMMIRFNEENLNPPLKLEGSDSLSAHVKRAIDWVKSMEENYPENLPFGPSWPAARL